MTNDTVLCSAENTDQLLDLEIAAGLNAFARGPLLLETILWGIFSCLIAFSVFVWMRDGIRSRQRLVMMALCVVMYLVSTAHWGVSVGWWHKTSQLQEARSFTNIREALSGHVSVCSSFVAPDPPEDLLWAQTISLPTCAIMTLLTINIILSDAIVLFRACVIWACNRVVQITSLMLFVPLFGLSVYNLCITCALHSSTAAMCSFCSTTGTIVVTISLVLNLWATAVVGRKTWTHMRRNRNLVRIATIRIRPEKIMVLIVESGALYCVLWTVVLSGEIIGLHSGSIILSLQNSSLIQLVGMYPTVLVTAAAFERLQGDAVVSNVDAPTPSPYLSKHLVSAAHDATDPTMPSHENSTRDDR